MDMKTIFEPFLGAWEGEGQGSFPTIEDFEYREGLRFEILPERTELTVTQNTVKRRNQEAWEPSHLELGLIQVGATGEIEWTNVQSGGRMEILRAPMVDGPVTKIRFMSVAVGNDPKERPATADERSFEIDGDTLTYRVRMTTTHSTDLTHHLEARLKRVGG
jgi:hypothetical protein